MIKYLRSSRGYVYIFQFQDVKQDLKNGNLICKDLVTKNSKFNGQELTSHCMKYFFVDFWKKESWYDYDLVTLFL